MTQQRHFSHALFSQASHFDQHVFKGTADFFAAGVRHYAVAAIFAATFHDGHEGGRPIHLGGRQVIELFNLGKRDVDLRPFFGGASGQKFGQAVQSLRAKHHVDIGCAFDDVGAFLAGHTAPHANQNTFFFEVLHAA